MPRRLAAFAILIMLGLLLSLAGPAPRANAATPSATPTLGPTPTYSQLSGFYWSGENLGTDAWTTSTSNATLSTSRVCPNKYGGYMVGVIAVFYSADTLFTASVDFYNFNDSASYGTIYKTTTSFPTTMIFMILDRKFNIPSSILDTLALITSGSQPNETVLISYLDFEGMAYKAYVQGKVSSTGTLYQKVLNVLCWIPPINPTLTPTLTSTPTPTVTVTPPIQQRITLPSGGSLQVNRAISYGDVAVTSSIGGLLVVFMLWAFLHRRAD